MTDTLAFVGGGNMAEALISGLLRQRRMVPEQISVSDIQPDRLAYLASGFGVHTSRDTADLVRRAATVVLAVKPQGIREVLDEIRPAMDRNPLIISIAAGVSLATLAAGLPSGSRIIRAMPNTPALVGRGVTAICRGDAVTEDDVAVAEAVLGAAGRVWRVDETAMDAVTAISGSGPAYVFYLMEAMLDAAERMGLSPETAREWVLDTVEGAAVLCRETGRHPETLRQQVTSKGGTTAAALDVMQEESVNDHLVTAILAAQQRARELAEQNA